MTRDFRDAAFSVVHDLMRADPNIIVLTNDNGAWGLDTIRKEYAERVINMGVAEQNMMSVAAGLTSCGKRVFVYGQCAHLMRAWEQIKVCICLPNLPVTIIGVGAGLSMWKDGPTHFGTEDVALMRVFDNMTIYNPADWICAEWCVKKAAEARTPHYIRLDKHSLAPIYREGQDFSDGYCVFGDDSGEIVISTGVETQRARRSDAPCVIDIFQLNPEPPALWDYFEVLFASKDEGDIMIREEHARGGLVAMLGELVLTGADDGPLIREFIEDGAEREPVPDTEPGWTDDGYGFPFNG